MTNGMLLALPKSTNYRHESKRLTHLTFGLFFGPFWLLFVQPYYPVGERDEEEPEVLGLASGFGS